MHFNLTSCTPAQSGARQYILSAGGRLELNRIQSRKICSVQRILNKNLLETIAQPVLAEPVVVPDQQPV